MERDIIIEYHKNLRMVASFIITVIIGIIVLHYICPIFLPVVDVLKVIMK
jgi:hypothetical protein